MTRHTFAPNLSFISARQPCTPHQTPRPPVYLRLPGGGGMLTTLLLEDRCTIGWVVPRKFSFVKHALGRRASPWSTREGNVKFRMCPRVWQYLCAEFFILLLSVVSLLCVSFTPVCWITMHVEGLSVLYLVQFSTVCYKWTLMWLFSSVILIISSCTVIAMWIILRAILLHTSCLPLFFFWYTNNKY